MKILVFGSEAIIQRLSTSLAKEEIEVVSTTRVPGQERFDLAIVDSSVERAETICRNIKQLWGIPVVLMITGGQADWERLQSLDSDAYIPGEIGATELAARLRAVVRRQSGAGNHSKSRRGSRN